MLRPHLYWRWQQLYWHAGDQSHCSTHCVPLALQHLHTFCQATGVEKMANLDHCRYLEEELARRYRDAAPATLALLQQRCEAVAGDLVAAEAQLQAAEDVTALRRAGGKGSFL